LSGGELQTAIDSSDAEKESLTVQASRETGVPHRKREVTCRGRVVELRT